MEQLTFHDRAKVVSDQVLGRSKTAGYGTPEKKQTSKLLAKRSKEPLLVGKGLVEVMTKEPMPFCTYAPDYKETKQC